MKELVETVVITYKRKENIPLILQSLKNQTVKNKVTLIDVSPSKEFEPSADTLKLADRVFKFGCNFGSFNRYVPLLSYDAEYTCFLDDDMLPGNKMLECYIDAAKKIGSFGVIGQIGRKTENGRYVCKDVTSHNGFVEVDLVVRCYFVKTHNLKCLPNFLSELPNDILSLKHHDDMMISYAMKRYGLRSFVISANGEQKCNKKELSDNYALAKLGPHLIERQKIIDFWNDKNVSLL